MTETTNVFSENINEQLKHDAPFAWYLRYQACRSPIFDLSDIEELDERLNAYLDALRISELQGHSLADSIDLDDWGARFVLFWLGLACDKHDYCLQAVEDIMDEEQSNELAEAFSWFSELSQLDAMLETLGDSSEYDNPLLRRAAIRACRLNDISLSDKYLREVLSGDDAVSLACILDYIAHQRLDYHRAAETLSRQHEDEDVRLMALVARAYTPTKQPTKQQQGEQDTQALLQDFLPFITEPSHLTRRALRYAFVIADVGQADALLAHVNTSLPSGPDYPLRLKIYAMGVSGRVTVMPELLALLDDEEYAQAAGEAIALITGVDIEDDDLSLAHGDYAMHEMGEEGEDEADEDGNAEWKSDYEDDLPLPGALAVRQWWAENRTRFTAPRYLAGQTLSAENMRHVLQTGQQGQRQMAAYHLAYLTGEKIAQVTAMTHKLKGAQ